MPLKLKLNSSPAGPRPFSGSAVRRVAGSCHWWEPRHWNNSPYTCRSSLQSNLMYETVSTPPPCPNKRPPSPEQLLLPSCIKLLSFFFLCFHTSSSLDSFKRRVLCTPFPTSYQLEVCSSATMSNPAMEGGNFRHNNTEAPEYTDRVLPLFSLKGRTAIVSGAGAGIGLGVAHALAEAGANVAIWYNSNKKAIAEAENIEKRFGVKCKLLL